MQRVFACASVSLLLDLLLNLPGLTIAGERVGNFYGMGEKSCDKIFMWAACPKVYGPSWNPISIRARRPLFAFSIFSISTICFPCLFFLALKALVSYWLSFSYWFVNITDRIIFSFCSSLSYIFFSLSIIDLLFPQNSSPWLGPYSAVQLYNILFSFRKFLCSSLALIQNIVLSSFFSPITTFHLFISSKTRSSAHCHCLSLLPTSLSLSFSCYPSSKIFHSPSSPTTTNLSQML